MKKSRTSPAGFQEFWDAYGLKLDRIGAERAWSKLSQKDRRAALEGVSLYKEICEQRGIRMMYAQGYLNHRRWEDEPPQEERTDKRNAEHHTSQNDSLSVPVEKTIEEMELW